MLFSGIPRLPIVFALQVARWQVAIWPGGKVTGGTKKIGKWGIPEKSIKNVTQLRWNFLRRTLQSKIVSWTISKFKNCKVKDNPSDLVEAFSGTLSATDARFVVGSERKPSCKNFFYFRAFDPHPPHFRKIMLHFFKLATKPSKVAGTLYFWKAWVREHQQKIVAFSQCTQCTIPLTSKPLVLCSCKWKIANAKLIGSKKGKKNSICQEKDLRCTSVNLECNMDFRTIVLWKGHIPI